ncbi:hypothetical protein IWX87_002334 [Polaromonas sp. CG_9.7]|nr:hypothetical protein [Polaromonas sp. CG_9.7]MBG6114710.1 hypothetical protein [Polaromonas sp. CG_9.2]MDH6185125.1 hypothetical protein [Polaromonas sp. CG_23.6]
MAAFETTPVTIFRADPPTIVQRFLATSERFLFYPPADALVQVRAPLRCAGVLHDEGSFCWPSPRCSQPGEQTRAAA